MREFGGFYKAAGGGEGERCNYPDRLDLYGCGCQHDCSYCYAKSLLDFRKLWNPVEPSVANIEKVSKTVKQLKPGSVIRLGGMTDCFAPIEEREGVTLKAMKLLNKQGVHQLIVTKSDLIASPEYMRNLDPELAHIQISITGTDDAVVQKYEKAAPVSKRMRAIETLSKAGFDVQVRISPYLDKNFDLAVLSRLKVDKALVEFLRVNHWVEKWLDYDFSEYTWSEGGYKHMHLRKKIRKLRDIQRIFPQVSVCEDVDGHYQHFQAFVNANPDDCCNLRLES